VVEPSFDVDGEVNFRRQCGFLSTERATTPGVLSGLSELNSGRLTVRARRDSAIAQLKREKRDGVIYWAME
jgi:hypothetical protein